MEDGKNSKKRFLRFSAATDSVIKNLQKYKNDRLSPLGLKSMHLMTLCCLDDTGEKGMTSAELAKSCGVDKAFVSRVTRELCALGYVGCKSEDGGFFTPRYKKHIVLTERGRETMKAVNKIIDEAVRRITDGLPDDKIEIFYQVLDRFNNNIKELCADTQK